MGDPRISALEAYFKFREIILMSPIPILTFAFFCKILAYCFFSPAVSSVTSAA